MSKRILAVLALLSSTAASIAADASSDLFFRSTPHAFGSSSGGNPDIHPNAFSFASKSGRQNGYILSDAVRIDGHQGVSMSLSAFAGSGYRICAQPGCTDEPAWRAAATPSVPAGLFVQLRVFPTGVAGISQAYFQAGDVEEIFEAVFVDAFMAREDVLAIDEDTVLTVPVANLSGNDDVTGTVTVTEVRAPSNGTVSLANGIVVFQPAPEFSGTAGFDYVLSNGFVETVGHAKVEVAAVDDPTVFVLSQAARTQSGGLTPVDPGIVLSDVDGPSIDGLVVSISHGYAQGTDSLSFTPSSGITGSFNQISGQLTLSGEASHEAYQTVLRSVMYSGSAAVTGETRIIQFGNVPAGSASLYYAANGHFYEFVSAPGMRWDTARNAAASRRLYGLTGYLATVTSAGENAFIADRLQGNGWLGGSDAQNEGIWRWVVGPEAGTHFATGASAPAGSPASPGYANWEQDEPNNQNNAEHYVHMIPGSAGIGPNGSWNDLPVVGGDASYRQQGYIVEYGGMPGETIVFPQLAVTMSLVR